MITTGVSPMFLSKSNYNIPNNNIQQVKNEMHSKSWHVH